MKVPYGCLLSADAEYLRPLLDLQQSHGLWLLSLSYDFGSCCNARHMARRLLRLRGSSRDATGDLGEVRVPRTRSGAGAR
jgi:hypothetical protein